MTTSTPPRRRDAAGTQQLLLAAARRRFAFHGYAATTVRDIADEAGVNVALINRYFASKEGLFKACLTGAVDEIGRTVPASASLDQVPAAIARVLAGAHPSKHPSQLLMLLRTSGDERADEIRLSVLRSFSERLASIGGGPVDDQRLLRAQVALCAALGMALLRSTAALEPLASASETDLVPPVRDLIDGLLS